MWSVPGFKSLGGYKRLRAGQFMFICVSKAMQFVFTV